MGIQIAWTDIDALEKKVSQPSKFATEMADRLGQGLYENMYAHGFRTPADILGELKRRMVQPTASVKSAKAKKSVMIGKEAAAQNK